MFMQKKKGVKNKMQTVSPKYPYAPAAPIERNKKQGKEMPMVNKIKEKSCSPVELPPSSEAE